MADQIDLYNKLEKMDDKLDVLTNNQTKIMSVLFDDSGNKGLSSKVNDLCEIVDKHKNNFTKVWIFIAVLFIVVAAATGFNLDKLLALAAAG